MEEAKRIYLLLLRSNGLKIREIAQTLELDVYIVAELMFSEECSTLWYQNDSSFWFAIEGALQIDEPKEEKDELIEAVNTPTKFNIDKFPHESISGSLRAYLCHIQHFRVYTNDELLELFRRYKNGDRKAYELIVKSQQRLVANMALRYNKRGVLLEDIIQEGNIGLIKAIERFDASQFYSFTNYAKNWIFQSISNTMTILPYKVKLPLSQLSMYKKFRRCSDKYELQYGFPPSLDELVFDKDIEYNQLVFLSQLPDNLSELVCSVDDLDSFESNYPLPDAGLMRESWNYYLECLLSQFHERNADIIKMHYGLYPYTREYSLEEIGSKYNLTRERTRQIREKTIRDLQLISKYSETYIEKNIPKRVDKSYTQKDTSHSYNTHSSSWFRSILPDKSFLDLFNPIEIKELQKTQKEPPFQNVTYNTSAFVIINEDNLCSIYKNKENLYSSIGTIKKIKGVLYRFVLSSSFYVNIIETSDFGKLATGLKIIEAHLWTNLYNELSANDLEKEIQDLCFDRHSGYLIKVNGVWYDHLGGYVNDYRNSPVSSNRQSKIPLDEQVHPNTKSNKLSKSSQQRWTPQREKDLVSFYNAGVDLEQLARIFETSTSSIKYKLSSLK